MLESNIYALWGAKQTAKGTAATVGTRRFKMVAGDAEVRRVDGSENFSDLERFGNMTDFVDTLVGEANPGIEATSNELAWLCWMFFGQETVTGSADPWSHVTTPGTNGGFWGTFWLRVGQNVIRRHKFNDCRITNFQIEGSTGAKVVRVTPTMLALDPGEIFDTDPVPATMPPEDPFLYTDGVGTFKLDTVQLSGHSQFTATWDEALSPYYGDDVVPLDLAVGNAGITIAVTLLVDTAGLQEYNKRIYGTASPVAGTKPLHVVPATGAYEFLLTRKNAAGPITPARTFKLEIPGIHWSPDVAVPPNPDGGATELSLAGQMRKVSGQPASRITIQTGTAAFTN